MGTSLITRQSCRVCGSKALSDVLSLGDHQIAGAFPKNGAISRRLPLELVRCDPAQDQYACGLLQLRHTVPPAILYHDYYYRSGVNDSMRTHLQLVADEASTYVGLKPGDLVIDIGSNDGTLLRSLPDAARTVGFEPSDVGSALRDIEVVRDFFSAERALRHTGGQKARLVFSIAMIYDLERPDRFVHEVADVLADDGLWVIECHYLPTMLERNQYDAIVHEHLEYYSLAVLERLLGEAGLVAVRAECNDVNGGSIRLYVRRSERYRAEGFDEDHLQRLRVHEFEMALDDGAVYGRFQAAVVKQTIALSRMCRHLYEDGKTIHVYGASTKGNTILQCADIGPDLVPAAAERNPDKVGSRTVTGIPIISEEESREMEPDYYLALPWHFMDGFVEREAAFLERGGKFIVPLPEVRLVP